MSAHGKFTGALRARARDALERDLARLGEAASQRSSLGVGAHAARPGARGGALYHVLDAVDQDRERTIERAAGAPKNCAWFGRRLTHCARGTGVPRGRASSPLRQVAPGAHFDLRRPPGRVRACRSRWRAWAWWRGNVCPVVRGGGAGFAPAWGGGLRVRSLPVGRGATRAERRARRGCEREARMILVRIAREGECVPRAVGAWGWSGSGCQRTCPRALRSDRGGRRERA